MMTNTLNRSPESGLSSFFSRFKDMIVSNFRGSNQDDVSNILLKNTRINRLIKDEPVSLQNAFTRGSNLNPADINNVKDKTFTDSQVGVRMMSIKMKEIADKGYKYSRNAGKELDSNGIDCSGFVWQSYNKMGVKLKTNNPGEMAKGTLQQANLDLSQGFTKHKVKSINPNNLPPEGSMILLLNGSQGPDDRHIVLVGKGNKILESNSESGTREGNYRASWNNRFKNISVITPTEAMKEKLFNNTANDEKLKAKAINSLNLEHGNKVETTARADGIIPQKQGVPFVVNKDLLGNDTSVYTNTNATLKPVVFDFK